MTQDSLRLGNIPFMIFEVLTPLDEPLPQNSPVIAEVRYEAERWERGVRVPVSADEKAAAQRVLGQLQQELTAEGFDARYPDPTRPHVLHVSQPSLEYEALERILAMRVASLINAICLPVHMEVV